MKTPLAESNPGMGLLTQPAICLSHDILARDSGGGGLILTCKDLGENVQPFIRHLHFIFFILSGD